MKKEEFNFSHLETAISNAERKEVQNYPYGYSLRTTLFDYVEFSPKKGFRHCTQTINPKTGRTNAPKKSTYSPFMIRWINSEGHIKVYANDFNSFEAILGGSVLIAKIQHLLSEQEWQFLVCHFIAMMKVSCKAQVVYCNADWEQLKPLIDEPLKTLLSGLKGNKNAFKEFNLDLEKIEALKDPDFKPFQVKKTYLIGANGMQRVAE